MYEGAGVKRYASEVMAAMNGIDVRHLRVHVHVHVYVVHLSVYEQTRPIQ